MENGQYTERHNDREIGEMRVNIQYINETLKKIEVSVNAIVTTGMDNSVEIAKLTSQFDMLKRQLEAIDAKIDEHIKNDTPLRTVISNTVMAGITIILSVIGLGLVNRWTTPIIDKLSPQRNLPIQTNASAVYHEDQLQQRRKSTSLRSVQSDDEWPWEDE